jgi:hypothetical protein
VGGTIEDGSVKPPPKQRLLRVTARSTISTIFVVLREILTGADPGLNLSGSECLMQWKGYWLGLANESECRLCSVDD